MLVISVSVDSYIPCLVDSVSHVLLVLSILSDSYTPLTLQRGFPISSRKDPMETSSLDSLSA